MKQHNRNMNIAALEQKDTKATQKHMRDNTADVFPLLSTQRQSLGVPKKRAANFHDKLRSFAVSPYEWPVSFEIPSNRTSLRGMCGKQRSVAVFLLGLRAMAQQAAKRRWCCHFPELVQSEQAEPKHPRPTVHAEKRCLFLSSRFTCRNPPKNKQKIKADGRGHVPRQSVVRDEIDWPHGRIISKRRNGLQLDSLSARGKFHERHRNDPWRNDIP